MFERLKTLSSSAERPQVREVLVADDVAEITELVGHWLESEGHRVTRASSGREVIEWVQKRAFDIVITDIVMPDGDGWDAILAVGRQRPETRIIAISGGGNLMPVEACLRVAKGVGADVVLKKPFGKSDFLAAFNRLASR
jgi:CheY-like chemotaxis protein